MFLIFIYLTACFVLVCLLPNLQKAQCLTLWFLSLHLPSRWLCDVTSSLTSIGDFLFPGHSFWFSLWYLILSSSSRIDPQAKGHPHPIQLPHLLPVSVHVALSFNTCDHLSVHLLCSTTYTCQLFQFLKSVYMLNKSWSGLAIHETFYKVQLKICPGYEFPNMAFQFSIDVFFMTYERSTPTRVRASSYWLLRTNCDLIQS